MSEAQRARALVVEDDTTWQQLVGEILRDMDLDVDVASSLEDAVLALRRTPHRLAVVDLALGEDVATNQDGLEVLEAVRRHDPGCATILLTGYATVELAVEVLTEYAALSCLRKSTLDRSEFRRLVDRALAVAPTYDQATGPDLRLVQADTARQPGSGVVASDAVLVIEDDAGWREILGELLTDTGYQVRLCGSYGEALGCLRRERYGLAVVDLSLREVAWGAAPGNLQDGYELLEEAQSAGVPTIVVSGVANHEEIERAYRSYGAFAYLEKQVFDRRAFLQAIRDAYAASAATQSLASLTPRELEVLAHLAQGMTNKELADALVITTNTVKRHLKAIFDKLGVHTRAAAVAKAVAAGLIAGTPTA